MGYKPSVIRTSVGNNDLLALVLNLKEIRDEIMDVLDKINTDIKMLEPILREKIERGKK